MLTAYFKLNIEYEDARQLLYSDIPTHFVYKEEKINNVKVYHWEPRKQYFSTIGRMYSVSPSQLELFFLRCLLLHVKGAESYADLMTVDGVVHQSYFEACLA